MYHTRLQVRAGRELRQQIKDVAKEEHCSQSEIVRTAISCYLTRLDTIKELRLRHQNNTPVVYPPVKQ